MRDDTLVYLIQTTNETNELGRAQIEDDQSPRGEKGEPWFPLSALKLHILLFLDFDFFYI